MTSLRQRMLEDMQVRNLSSHTQVSYVQQVSRFARHFDRSPETLGPEEIRAYPAPIPACDAQFNHLLELRRLLPGELARLEAAACDPAASVEAFVCASPCRAELSAPGQER